MADKEYIEREALLKKFTDAEIQDNKAVGIGEFLFAVIRGIIENQPAADVVEVVRCKNCEYFIASKYKPFCQYHTNNAGYCDEACWVNENDFCSYGERKEG